MALHEASELESLNRRHLNTCFQQDSPQGGKIPGADTMCKADQSNTSLSHQMGAGRAPSVPLYKPTPPPPGGGGGNSLKTSYLPLLGVPH